jgi:hypothetical protein
VKKTTGAYDKRSVKIGFQEWNLNAMGEEGQKLLKAILKEGFEIATEEAKCNAWLPIEWAGLENPSDGVGGPPPKDPTTIYVELPIGPNQDESPRWIFHLSDLIQSMIELNEEGAGGPIGGKQRENFAAVRDDLRRLADEIDAALNRPADA